MAPEDDVAKLADFGLARSLALFLEEPTGSAGLRRRAWAEARS